MRIDQWIAEKCEAHKVRTPTVPNKPHGLVVEVKHVARTSVRHMFDIHKINLAPRIAHMQQHVFNTTIAPLRIRNPVPAREPFTSTLRIRGEPIVRQGLLQFCTCHAPCSAAGLELLVQQQWDRKESPREKDSYGGKD